MPINAAASKALELLREHRRSFFAARAYADDTGHTVPSDTKSWSQILVSILTGIAGLKRKKGRDLQDGSDVKAANAWDAIDVPRFNGAIPAGRGGKYSDVSALDDMPHLFFVLWDWSTGNVGSERCRVWAVRAQVDPEFRRVATRWYEAKKKGSITSDNFQLHPPIGHESDVVKNECGNLVLPLLFRADWVDNDYCIKKFDQTILRSGLCSRA
jgi:hypothetical protein